MITLEDYKLAYNLYLQDGSLEASMNALELRSLTESTEVIQEDTKETIRKYVNKVVAGIQKAWDMFKDNVSKTTLKWKDEEITKAIANNPVNISVDNYVEYDTEKLQSLTIRDLDYGTMKSDLEDKNTFMKRYYSNIFTDENKSIYDNLKAKMIKSKSNKKEITRDDLNTMYTYMKGHKAYLDKVQKDLDTINKAAKAADNLASTANKLSTTTSTPNNGGESNVNGESTIMVESSREKVLNTVIKALEDLGCKCNVTKRSKDKWLKTGNSGEFSGKLCIAGLGSDGLSSKCSKVNKVIKPLGGKLSPDNYGTAFLSVKESVVNEDGEKENQISSTTDNDTGNGGGENKDRTDEAVKGIQTYFKCISELLSAEMKLSREIYYFYNSVIKQHMQNSTKNKSKEEEEKPQVNTNDTVAQINT